MMRASGKWKSKKRDRIQIQCHRRQFASRHSRPDCSKQIKSRPDRDCTISRARLALVVGNSVEPRGTQRDREQIQTLLTNFLNFRIGTGASRWPGCNLQGVGHQSSSASHREMSGSRTTTSERPLPGSWIRSLCCTTAKPPSADLG